MTTRDEDLVRDGLNDAVATEPPLRCDAEEIASRARRERSRRRAVLGTVAATAVVAVAGTLLAMPLGQEAAAPRDPVGHGGVTPPPPPLWPVPTADGTYTPRQYEEAAVEGRDRVEEAFEALPAGVRLAEVSRNTLDFDPGNSQQYWSYALTVVTATGTYQAELHAYVDATGRDDASDCATTHFDPCETFPVPGVGQGLYGVEAGDPESRVEVRVEPGRMAWLILDGTFEEPTPLSRQEMTGILADIIR
ncbi:hypothetical protein ACTWP5_31525 [Streptomyces sp. 4N509B]|uniref:hypothetical protein n=1 Tax=Streptomyces sp. 4N509B TaxID=3457413 RepID=UPI003FD661F6